MRMTVSTDIRPVLVIKGAMVSAVWSVMLVSDGDVVGVDERGWMAGELVSSLVMGVRFQRSGPLRES